MPDFDFELSFRSGEDRDVVRAWFASRGSLHDAELLGDGSRVVLRVTGAREDWAALATATRLRDGASVATGIGRDRIGVRLARAHSSRPHPPARG